MALRSSVLFPLINYQFMKKVFMPLLHMTLAEVFLVFINFLIHQLIGGEFFLQTNKKNFLLRNAPPFSQSIGALS
jgi:hypothetical protein